MTCHLNSAPFIYLHHRHRKSRNIIFILLLCLSPRAFHSKLKFHLFKTLTLTHLTLFLPTLRLSLVSYTRLRGRDHKVRHAQGGEGVREGVTVCDRGGGQERVTSRLYKILSYILNMKFKVMFNCL